MSCGGFFSYSGLLIMKYVLIPTYDYDFGIDTQVLCIGAKLLDVWTPFRPFTLYAKWDTY
jgi:hypothetical protein